ncbi:uncharacterized protein VDAG_05996 [Verticillium dahliae VdLs.17]|uniref:FAD-binding PCMH-type domain-containing protein n=1 Tax=Verticillium dahliae (strain VdLs.17 / ATCC MYA-4575 / FGSC 10137) TaxID=498257 RepID=G2X855_VERDV|nr:uncharacterized protein VDAG_05996 [Verticillium dahliae VdLs.17]EGY15142.1 hypothetical protein VDAG_05996 [Verticillium dahliae VdLs.17]
MSTLYEPLGYGVGGLSLGGGASFHTGKRGFTCDDIVNYEIVLADGTIANANAVENPGLHRASKGGGNNFGIVTRFDLQTFEDAKGGLYGGLLFSTCDDRDAILAQSSRLVEINHEPPKDTEVIAFTYGGSGAPIIAVLTPVLDDRSRKTYGKVITDFATPGGAIYVCSAVQNNMDVLKKISALCDAFVADLTSLWPELGIDFVIQPFPSTSPTGGMESVAFAKLAALTAELGAYAESKDAATTWRYLNYVSPAQDPFSTFGEEKFQLLEKVAAEYDPKGFFQPRVSGGFKIPRVQ